MLALAQHSVLTVDLNSVCIFLSMVRKYFSKDTENRYIHVLTYMRTIFQVIQVFCCLYLQGGRSDLRLLTIQDNCTGPLREHLLKTITDVLLFAYQSEVLGSLQGIYIRTLKHLKGIEIQARSAWIYEAYYITCNWKLGYVHYV